VRKDIKAQVEYYISLYCRANGIPNKPKVTPESCVAYKRMISAISGIAKFGGTGDCATAGAPENGRNLLVSPD